MTNENHSNMTFVKGSLRLIVNTYNQLFIFRSSSVIFCKTCINKIPTFFAEFYILREAWWIF